MKNSRILTAVIAVAVLMFSAYLFAITTEAKNADNTGEVTIKGEVIDVNCYLELGQKGRGPDHKECAISCAKAGTALAILTDDNKIYFPLGPAGVNNNSKLLDYVADNVEVTGTVYTQSGVSGIKISSIKKLE